MMQGRNGDVYEFVVAKVAKDLGSIFIDYENENIGVQGAVIQHELDGLSESDIRDLAATALDLEMGFDEIEVLWS